MTKRQRSPLGELVFAYRKKLHLTQADLAALANHPDTPDFNRATVSLRTVSAIERKLPPGAPKPRPHRPSTIRALAEALDLTPGTPAWDEFLDAARDARDSSPDDAAPSFPEPDIPLFVPDGREAHLQRLNAAIDRAAREHAGVIFVGAESGVGKTNLIAHACRQALDRHERLVVLWGDCTGRPGQPIPGSRSGKRWKRLPATPPRQGPSNSSPGRTRDASPSAPPLVFGRSWTMRRA